jgi:hypothetical protein
MSKVANHVLLFAHMTGYLVKYIDPVVGLDQNLFILFNSVLGLDQN